MKALHILAATIALPLGAQADVTAPGGKVIECYCTDTQGARVELGESICLFVGGRAFMARCEMSLNVPMWRETGDACVSSHRQGPMSTPDTGIGHQISASPARS